jgi:Ion channel
MFKHILNYHNRYFHFYKYDMLLFALIQHLFIGILLRDLDFYIHYIWPLNMIILGIASIGVFIEKEEWKKWLRNFFLVLIIGLPLSLWFNFEIGIHYMVFISAIYALFFIFILYEILRFLITPNYINLDIITAAACGYFLLIEIATFLFQFYYYNDIKCFEGILHQNPAEVFSSFVYFSSVTITSIGFGDIRPITHYTKLLTSLIGVIGQLYSVLLVGVLISKFNSSKEK